MTTRRRDTVTLVPGISGAQGTLSHEIRLRSGDFDALIEALKPEMRGQVEGLPLHEDASKLIERIKEFTGRISFGGAERVRAEFTSLVDRIVSAQSRTNALAAQARKSQSTVIADAVREEMREKLANYGRQCLRDRYVETLSATYAPEIAAGDLRVVA